MRVVALCLLAVMIGCTSMLPPPIERDVEWLSARGSTVDLSDLGRGRAAYVERCAGCHNLHSPASMLPEQWTQVVADMERDNEVKLDPRERDLILAYLTASSARMRSQMAEAR